MSIMYQVLRIGELSQSFLRCLVKLAKIPILLFKSTKLSFYEFLCSSKFGISKTWPKL